jgi:predicted DNA-binding transcriptional regulator AlpA
MKLIRKTAARERLGGISHWSIHNKMKNDPRFPKPVRLGKLTAFVESELDAYIELLGC